MDPTSELELDAWGTGAGHALDWSNMIGEVCPRCDGRGRLGREIFPVTCPECKGTRKINVRGVRTDG